MTDHKTEAENALHDAWKATSQDQHASLMADAQVHATLALAEQQRIANLIALAQFGDQYFIKVGLQKYADEAFNLLASATEREALGLRRDPPLR